jgi:small subunit ribosomal protein S1
MEREEVYQRLRLYDVVTGVVQNVQPYGVFVDIGGATALLHISQIPGKRLTIETLQELFEVGYDKL